MLVLCCSETDIEVVSNLGNTNGKFTIFSAKGTVIKQKAFLTYDFFYKIISLACGVGVKHIKSLS